MFLIQYLDSMFLGLVWLMFSKYSFQKKLFHIFPVQNKILKTTEECFQDTKNVFNDIVVNKLNTVDPTDLSKLLYLLKHKDSHTSNFT